MESDPKDWFSLLDKLYKIFYWFGSIFVFCGSVVRSSIAGIVYGGSLLVLVVLSCSKIWWYL